MRTSFLVAFVAFLSFIVVGCNGPDGVENTSTTEGVVKPGETPDQLDPGDDPANNPEIPPETLAELPQGALQLVLADGTTLVDPVGETVWDLGEEVFPYEDFKVALHPRGAVGLLDSTPGSGDGTMVIFNAQGLTTATFPRTEFFLFGMAVDSTGVPHSIAGNGEMLRWDGADLVPDPRFEIPLGDGYYPVATQGDGMMYTAVLRGGNNGHERYDSALTIDLDTAQIIEMPCPLEDVRLNQVFPYDGGMASLAWHRSFDYAVIDVATGEVLTNMERRADRETAGYADGNGSIVVAIEGQPQRITVDGDGTVTITNLMAVGTPLAFLDNR